MFKYCWFAAFVALFVGAFFYAGTPLAGGMLVLGFFAGVTSLIIHFSEIND